MFGNPDDFLDDFRLFDQAMNGGKIFNPGKDNESEDDDNG